MMKEIRVVTTDRRDKLDEMSRINYQKIYTVEHNAKVYDFGTVHKNHLRIFYAQWMFVLQHDSERNPDMPGRGGDEESDGDDGGYAESEHTARPEGYDDDTAGSYNVASYTNQYTEES
jgi:hypothetical protein